MGLREFVWGLVVGACLVGCASFTYPYYGIDAESYNGTLKGPELKDDIAFHVCKPNEFDKAPCVAMRAKDFLAMKQELLTLRAELKSCQESH